MKEKPYQKARYWTRERVIQGLMAFAQDTAQTPPNSNAYAEMLPRQEGSWRKNPGLYPSASTVLKHFSSMAEAWQACGFTVSQVRVLWSAEEDAYLRQHLGFQSPQVIADHLQRSLYAIFQRVEYLGLRRSQPNGITVEMLARWSGISRYLITKAISQKQIAAFAYTRYIYLDPADILNLPGLDPARLPDEAQTKIRAALMLRLVNLLTYGDARHGSQFRYGTLHSNMSKRELSHTLPKGYKDRTGQRYGLLTVKRLKHVNLANQNVYWICICDCGEPRTVEGKSLASDNGIKACVQCMSKQRLQKLSRKKRKYHFTAKLDRRLQEIYEARRGRSYDRLPEMKALASEVGYPAWVLRKRARDLGLTRIKEQPWSERELSIVKTWAHLTPNRIAVKLRASGFERTETAVRICRKRMKLDMNNHGQYSASQVAYGFGIDPHFVVHWIKEGKLAATNKGTSRKPSKQGGDQYIISRADVRNFCFAHPMAFDLGKVDQMWFMHVMSDGAVEMTRKVAKRGKRG